MSKICFVSIDVEHDPAPEQARYGAGPEQSDSFEGVKNLNNILDIFKKHKVKATLFITGKILEKHSNLVQEWAEDYEIGCHNYFHECLDKMDLVERERQIKRFVKNFQTVFGKSPKGFRAPRNIIDNEQFKILERYNFLYDGSVVPRHIILHKYEGYKGRAPRKPYFPSKINYKKKGDGKILEIPCAPLFGGIPFAATWIRKLGTGFFKLMFKIKKPKFLALTMHSWDSIKFKGKSSKNSGEKYIKQLDEMLGYLKEIGYEFKGGEEILHDANVRI